MLGLSLVRATCFVGVLASTVVSQECVPRPVGQLVENSGFESGDDEWTGRNAPVATVPTYPAHSGSHMLVMSALYTKAEGAAAVNIDSYTSQLLGDSRTGITYQVKAFYNVYSYSKGESCPDANLPKAQCKLTVSYANQVLDTINLSSTGGYVEFSPPFTPETSGRYLQFALSCRPTTEAPQCADIVVLLDDVTYSDPGHTCWTSLGCYTDSVSNRALVHHGRIANWPHTTTIQNCQEACGNQGYSYAGLEYGCECWCGDELVDSGPASSGCTMPCSGDSHQICGGPDRLNLYQRP